MLLPQNTRQNSRVSIGKKIQSKDFFLYLIRQFYKFNHLPVSSKGEVFNIGYTTPHNQLKFIEWFMNNWVNWMDKQLDKLQHGTDAYADILGYRGFNFPEFKYVVSGRVSDEALNQHRVFEYLFLTNQIEREFFTVSNTDDELKLLESYHAAIYESIDLEIPVLQKFFSTKIPLFFSSKSLKKHCYILGRTGSGKSELIKFMFYELQRRSQKTWNKTLMLIEPHGDLSLEVLAFKLNSSTKKDRDRIIYLDPFIRDTARQIFGEDIFKEDYTFVLNPFDYEGNENKEINYLTQELSSAFFEVLKNDSTTQMDALIEACVETLIRKKDADITHLKSFMDDDENEELLKFGVTIPNPERRKMMKKIKEDSKLRPTKSSIYYRLQSLIGDSEFRRLLVGKSTINLQKEMDSGKVIICNLSKAKMGQKTAPVFGKLLMALIQGYATKRQDLPKNKRKETYCFVDEFQNYTTPSIETILAENRKYSLYMILANQVIGQNMDTEMRRIILGNTALKLAGKNEQDSLKIMSENMGNLTPKDFEKLPQYSFYVNNQENKSNHIQTVRVPDFLVKYKPPFYMPKRELKELFLWLVHKSGYYKKVEKDIPLSGNSNSNTQQNIYDPKFDE